MSDNNNIPPFLEVIKWKGSKDIKFEILLRITTECNLDCRYCFSQKRFENPDLKDIISGFRRIAKDENIKLGDPILINITGGEPLIRKDLFDLIESLGCVFKNYTVNLQTNATLIDKNTAIKMRSLNITSAFVGVPALSEGDYSFLTRRRGYYNRAISGVENLLNANIRVCLNFVLNSISERGFYDIPSFIRSRFNGGVSVNLSTLSPGTPEQFLRSYGLDYIRCGEILEEIYSELCNKSIKYGAFGGDCSPPVCAFKSRDIIRSFAYWAGSQQIEYLSDFKNIKDGYRYKSDGCKRCRFDRSCPGVSSIYAKVFGKKNFSY